MTKIHKTKGAKTTYKYDNNKKRKNKNKTDESTGIPGTAPKKASKEYSIKIRSRLRIRQFENNIHKKEHVA